jgi:hypothetical protein
MLGREVMTDVRLGQGFVEAFEIAADLRLALDM